ncbi:MAG TPA: hypothetical protein VFS90_19205 [Pyrinomonadaceae bacterium]|nr:hypothetical protein [Pyrinomonadaceae bacterium]
MWELLSSSWGRTQLRLGSGNYGGSVELPFDGEASAFRLFEPAQLARTIR